MGRMDSGEKIIDQRESLSKRDDRENTFSDLKISHGSIINWGKYSQIIQKVNPTGLINVHRAYLNEPVGLVDALKEQLDQLKAHFYPDLINQSICLSS